jgi:tetrapyrrole methylase family protein/MazG family protein
LEKKIAPSDTSFTAVLQLIRTLRGENGCPWDKKQTPRSIVLYLIEEAYELMDAIHSGKPDDIREELGDVLFLVLFLALQFQENGAFKIEEMVQTNLEKMTRRHPHVFGTATANTPEEVRERWHRIKASEKANPSAPASILESVPDKLPALMRCYRISERAARTGFDWHDLSGVMRQAEEEWDEFKRELVQEAGEKRHAAQALEFGDVLFTLVNVARLSKIHPEEALALATKKFETRFKFMEKLAREGQRTFESLSFEEMHLLWNKAKRELGDG